MSSSNAMSALSRRSLVTTLTALPTLALPVIVIAAPAELDDPIYGAIKACVEAERIDAETMTQLEVARERFKAKYGFEEPDGIRKEIREAWAQHEEIAELSTAPCDSHETIDKLVDVIIRDFGIDWEWVRPRLHNELDRQTAAYNETVKPLDDARLKALESFDEASQALLDRVPTTLAGLAALFACFRDNDPLREELTSDDDYIKKLVATVASATARLAAQS